MPPDQDIEARRDSSWSAETATNNDGHLENESGLGGASDLQRRVTLQDQTDLLPRRQLIIVFIGLAITIFLAFLDQTIVSTALPVIGQEFGSSDQVQWIGTSYLLASTVVQPLAGRLSDIFGRKHLLLCAIVIFLLGNILCTAAQSMNQLIAFRALAGVGGGIILTSVMTIVSDVVSLRQRGKYQGLIGVFIAVAGAIGPLIGGGFSEKLSWRYCFGLAIPLSIFAVIVNVIWLPLKPVTGSIRDKLLKIDYLGVATVITGLVLFLLAINWGGTTFPWDGPAVLTTLILGIVFLVLFGIVEWRYAALPIIPIRLFANLTISSVNAVTFLTGIIYYCQLYYVPVVLQAVRGSSPLISGLQLLPLLILQTILSFASGWIVSKTGHYRPSIISGFCIWAVAQGLISTIGSSTSEARILGYLALAGAGAGGTFQTSLIAAQAACDRKDMAVVTSLRNFWRSVGGSVGLSVGAAILNNRLLTGLDGVQGLTANQIQTIRTQSTSLRSIGLDAVQLAAVEEVYSRATQGIWYFCIPSAVLAALLAIFGIRHHSLGAHDRKTVADLERREKAREAGQEATEEAEAKETMTTDRMSPPVQTSEQEQKEAAAAAAAATMHSSPDITRCQTTNVVKDQD